MTVHTVCANFLDFMLGRGPKFRLLPSRGRDGVGRAWKTPHRIRLFTSFGLKHSLGISYLEGKVPPSLGSVQDLTSLMPLKCTFRDFAFLNWRLYGEQPWPVQYSSSTPSFTEPTLFSSATNFPLHFVLPDICLSHKGLIHKCFLFLLKNYRIL